MHIYDLLSEIRRRRKWVQMGEHIHKYKNLLNREFNADHPKQKWVTDISYIQTKEGVLYLPMIRDLYDRSIVAYKTDTLLLYSIWPTYTRDHCQFLLLLLFLYMTHRLILWLSVSIFPPLSIFCSAFYAAILLGRELFPADAIQQLHDEIDPCLRLLEFQATSLVDTIQHITFCTHNCIS